MAIISSPSPKRSPNQKPKKLLNLFSFNTISSPSSSSSQTASSSPCSSSSSESMMDETIKDADTIIHKWEINDHSDTRSISMFQENKTEVAFFMKCVKGLHRLMHFLAAHDSQSEKLFIAQKLMKIAMKRLEKEFHLILLNHSGGQQLKPELMLSAFSRTSIDQSDIEQLPTLAISNLRLIVDTMISCGYSKECIQVYKNIRKLIIDEALFQLGIQQYSSSQINKMLNASHFDDHVKTWVNAAQIAMKKLFCDEKLLCKHIFTSNEQIRNSCFEISTKEGALNLFKFPELIATKCKKLKSETVFIMLDLHNSILDLWPEIESLFSTESVAPVKVQALASLHKLGDSIRTVLGELESSIHKSSCRIKVSGDGVHTLSNSVMDYLSSLASYGDSLSNVIVNDHEQQSLTFVEAATAVSIKFGSIIDVLLSKLDGKAKLHYFKALPYLFLVNNLNFIIEKVRSTNMRFILGEEWIATHEKKLDAYVLSYETMTWYKVIACLPNTIYVSREKARACFRKLCFMFEEVYVKQKTWTVVDEFMRDKMKVSIVKNLVPVYEEFYAKHLITLSEDELCVKLLMKLSPENMMKYLLELFPETAVGFRDDETLPVVPVSQGSCLFR